MISIHFLCGRKLVVFAMISFCKLYFHDGLHILNIL